MNELPPWDSDGWQFAEFREVLSLEARRAQPEEVSDAVRITLGLAGYKPTARVASVKPPGPNPGSTPSFSVLFERPLHVGRGKALRDFVSPDGTSLVPVTIGLLLILLTVWIVGRFSSPFADPRLFIIVGVLLFMIIGAWVVARTRRFVRTGGLKVDFLTPNPSLFDQSVATVRIVVSASQLVSQVGYPKPNYEARRGLIDSHARSEPGPILVELRTSILGAAGGIARL